MTRTERTYYVVSAGYNLGQFLLAPVYPLFLLSRGLDLFEINLVLAVYLLTTFALDIPTGAVADRFGRKISFLLACAVRTAAFLLYSRARGLADCLVAEVIDGVGTTLATGALEAWAVDGVRAEGDRGPSDRMFARAQAITQVTMIFGGLTSGYVAQHDLTRPWFLAAAMFTATGLVGAALMHEAPRHRRGEADQRRSLGATAAAAIGAVMTTPPLLLLCALTLAGSFAVFPIWQYWQVRVAALTGEGPWVVGWVLAATNVAGLLANAVLPRLVARFGRARVLTGASIWRAAAIAVAAGAARAPAAIGGIVFHGTASSVSEPVLTAWTNEHVGAEERATVLSVRSTFFTLGGAMGLVGLGLLGRAHGIPAAWSVSAGVLLLAAPGYLALGRIAMLHAPALAVELPVPPSKVSAPGV